MKVSQLYPSKYLRSDDLQGRRVTATVRQVVVEDVAGDGSQQKPVVYFQGRDKGLVLNRTNAAVLAQALGEETDLWPTAVIEISAVPVPYQGRISRGCESRR